MIKKKTSLYWIILVVYIGVIGILLYLQFTGNEPFSESIGNISITGQRVNPTFWKKGKLKEISIDYQGVSFPFSSASPLVVSSQEDRSSKLQPVSYSTFPDGLEITFGKDTKLGFRLEGNLGEKLIVKLMSEDSVSASLPFRVLDGEIEEGKNIPILALQNARGRFYINLPAGSRIDREDEVLKLTVSCKQGCPEIEISVADSYPDNLYLYWFANTGPLAGDGDYEQGVREFLNKAYLGWSKNRYVIGRGRWVFRNEEPQYRENLGSAWIAESIERGEYALATAFFQAATDIWLRENPGTPIDHVNTPFIGGLDAFTNARFESEESRRREIEDLIRNRDPSIFQKENLIPFVLNGVKPAQIDDLVTQLVVSLDIGSQDMETCLGMLESYFAVYRWYRESENYFIRFKEVIGDRILPDVRRVDNRLYLSDGGSTVDLAVSLRAGFLLRKTGLQDQNSALKELGQTMILSALSYSDDLGFIPEALQLGEDSTESAGNGYISPESVYRWIGEPEFWPEEIPLYPVTDPGVWAWTAANLQDIRSTGNSYSFRLTYPPGLTHYFLLSGVPPIANLYIRGLQWRSDPNFAQYPSGWFYDEKFETLYLKLTHVERDEEIVIDF